MDNLIEILQILSLRQVEFLIVGGVSAVLNGAPVNTFDLDIVHHRTPENLDRLVAALDEIDAVYRWPRERRLKPTQAHLVSTGHHLLATRFGPLDVLGQIGDSEGYEQLLPHCFDQHITPLLKVKVLGLEKLIQVKEATGREKDRIHLLTLRRTLEERNKL